MGPMNGWSLLSGLGPGLVHTFPQVGPPGERCETSPVWLFFQLMVGKGMKEVRAAHSGFQRCPPPSFLCHFPLSSTRAMCRDHHMATWAPYGSISQRDSQEHKNAAVYFYDSPFSVPPSALQMASAPLLGSHTWISTMRHCPADLGVLTCQWQGTSSTFKTQYI